MELGRRVAIEKDIGRNEANFYKNLSKNFRRQLILDSFKMFIFILKHLTKVELFNVRHSCGH